MELQRTIVLEFKSWKLAVRLFVSSGMQTFYSRVFMPNANKNHDIKQAHINQNQENLQKIWL